MPFNFEVNIKRLIYKYKKDITKKILLPFIEEESFKMVQYRLPMRRNSFGILEPTNSLKDEKNVDMIIVPVVGVDGDMKRVGFGKGMYDRFYEKLKNKPLVVFIQIKKCFTNDKICDSYDISCDYYVTPKETLYTGKKNDTRDYFDGSRCNRRRASSLF
jgi:5-formyltetrahydrofolate cyclo-ligase